MSLVKAKTAPSRRVLATTMAKAIHVINGQSQNQDVLKADVDALKAWQAQWTSLTRWQRVKWVLGF